MLNPKVMAPAKKAVPSAIYRRLDPFEATIASFVTSVATNTPDDQLVLDAGAGESRFRGLFDHTRYVAIDFGFGDQDWDYSGLDIVGRCEDLPLADASCDRVLSVVVLEHTPEPARVIEEFRRVLKPGGSVHMVVPHMWEEHQRPFDYFRYTSAGISLSAREVRLPDSGDSPGGRVFLAARQTADGGPGVCAEGVEVGPVPVARAGLRLGPTALLLLSGCAGSRPCLHVGLCLRGTERVNGKLRNRMRIAASYFRRQAVLPGGPIEVTLESTAKCNLYCPMCPRHIYTFDDESMDLDLFRKIVADCKDYVEFAWPYGIGEPMIHPDIFEMIRITREAGIRTGMSTNATLLTTSGPTCCSIPD